MKGFWLILFCTMQLLFAQKNISAFFNSYLFYIPSTGKAYMEVSLTFEAHTLKKNKNKDNKLYSEAKVKIEILKTDSIVKIDSFIVKSPPALDSSEVSNFLSLKRYWLSNKTNYQLKIHIKDNLCATCKIFSYSEQISTNFKTDTIAWSSVELLEQVQKSETKDIFYKNGFTMIPHNINYFPDNTDVLTAYTEIYNTDTVLGKATPFVVYYYIKNKDDNKDAEGLGGYKKLNAAKVNPILLSMPLKTLPSGNYYLIMEAKNKDNQIISSVKHYFQRKNTQIKTTIPTVGEQMFFGNQNNADTLKMWVESLWPISNNLEKDWVINQSIDKNPQNIKNFIINFFEKRASDTVPALELWKRHYVKYLTVMKLFKCGKIAPYYTDRGRVYLQYGPPDQRTAQPAETAAYPYEIWQYYRIKDATNNQFFTNKKFVFVNKAFADNCYSLVHSDMKGEINNPLWQNEVLINNNQDINNPNNTPQKNFGNNFDKLYQNPQ